MRVLVGIPCLLTGGTEIQTLSLVEALIAAGHEVTVACYFEHAEAMVARYEAAGARVELLSADGSRPVGIKQITTFLYKRFKDVVRRWHPDVAHVQYMAPGALPILILRWLGVRTIVATAHTSGDIYSSLRLVHWLTRHILTAFQCITLRAEKSFFGDARMFSGAMPWRKRGNHFTIYNTLPGYISVADTGRRIKSGPPKVIGVVSRLERIKGMDLVVPAFVRIHAQYPGTRLLIVGDGSLRDMIESQVADAGLTDCVEFAGRQTQDRLQAYYDKIDVLLMPSRSEGFGLTAIEGMARGCVVVAADTGGLPEVVTADAGLLHRPGDEADIADKVLSLLADSDRLTRLGVGAVARASIFSAQEYGRQIAGWYSRL